MLQVRPDVVKEVEEALERYMREVRATTLTPSTQHTYLLHAENFVRWLKGEFAPGTRKQ